MFLNVHAEGCAPGSGLDLASSVDSHIKLVQAEGIMYNNGQLCAAALSQQDCHTSPAAAIVIGEYVWAGDC